MLAFLDMGFAEMLVCAFVALVLFGGRLPEVMRNLGATYRNFRKGMEDLKHQAGVDVRMPTLTGRPAKPYPPMPPPTPDPAMRRPEPAPVPAAPPPAASAPAAATGPASAPPRPADEDEPPLV